MAHIDKVNIIHDVLVMRESQKDTAKKFRVTAALVSFLVCKMKKKPDYLEDIKAIAQLKEEKVKATESITSRMIRDDQVIDRAATVR